MRTAAVVLNVILFAFVCLVVVVDGPPKEIAYIAFNLLILFTLIFNVVVISRTAVRQTGTAIRSTAILLNVAFLISSIWAFVQQYPHPKEDGFVAFVVLMAVAPILSLAVLIRAGTGLRWLRLHAKGKAS